MRQYLPPTPLDTPCQIWQGQLTDGYGRRYIVGQGPVYVHRWVWEQANGPIPDGMIIMHRCDNRPCFRLDHLFIGTKADNARDMTTKGRRYDYSGLKTHCPAGHPYDEANTYHYTRQGQPRRACRTCRRESDGRYWRRIHPRADELVPR